MTEWSDEHAEAFRKARLAAEMTQGELANCIGLTGSISAYENNRRAPTPLKLATAILVLRANGGKRAEEIFLDSPLAPNYRALQRHIIKEVEV